MFSLAASEAKINFAKTEYGRSIDEILAKLPYRTVYQILGAIEVLVSSKLSKQVPTSSGERMVFAFTWLAREVGMGGFRQFFINSAGDFWNDVLNGLGALQDSNGLRLFQHVLSIFPESTPATDRDTRLRQVMQLDENESTKVSTHFNETTAAYFMAPFPIWDDLLSYVSNHANEFDLYNA